MSTATTTSKWASSAGPRQTKQVEEALNALRWHGLTTIEVYDYGKMQSTQPLGEMRAEIATAIAEIKEQYDYQITRENFKSIIAACELAMKMNPIPEVDCRLSDEEKEQERINREEIKRKQDEKAAQRKAEYDKAIIELRAKYPWATNDAKLSPHARCAANVREELRRTFPGHKFSVKSESFAGGNAIDVHWSMGPTYEEVSKITNKYMAGTFDGMTDSYNYDHTGYSDAVSQVLGQIKYLHPHRNDGGSFEIIAKALCERQGVEYRERYQQGTFGANDTRPISAHVNEMLANVSFPPGATVTGIEDNPWDEWEAAGRPGINHTPYRITFTAPEAPSVDHSQACESSGAFTVQKHRHTKKQIDMWIVVLSNRVERDEFERLRDSCESAGGWYSRQWGRTPGGFAFRSEDAAHSWASANV